MSEPADPTPPAALHPPVASDGDEPLGHDVVCGRCGYNLRGLRPSGSCPECGLPAGRSLGVLPPMADEPLTRDVACSRCSYNLRGLRPGGSCPECGMPIENSLRGFLLRFAAPEYVQRIREGLTLVLIGLLVLVVFVVGKTAARIALERHGYASTLAWVIPVAMLIPSWIMIVGYWRYTVPDPGLVGQEQPRAARRVLRFAVVSVAGVKVITAVAAFLEGGASDLNVALKSGQNAELMLVTAVVLAILEFCAWVAQYLAALRYTSWIASRLPDPALGARAGTYMWLLPVLYVALYICLGLGPLVALVLYSLLLNGLRGRIRAIEVAGNSSSPSVPA